MLISRRSWEFESLFCVFRLGVKQTLELIFENETENEFTDITVHVYYIHQLMASVLMKGHVMKRLRPQPILQEDSLLLPLVQ